MHNLNWIFEHWDDIIYGISTVIAGASVLAKLTATQEDDKFLKKISNLLSKLTLGLGSVKK